MNQDIIAKIANLRKLANSSNIHEATAAAVAADKLIAKFRISEQDIANHEDIKIERDTGYIYESGRAITWKYNLCVMLAHHYSCFIYNEVGATATGRAVTRMRLTGARSDIELSKYMFTWLVFEIERLNLANKGKGHIVCNSFCLGAVNGIQEQLAISKKESVEEAIKNGQGTSIEKLDKRYNDAEELAKSLAKLVTVNTQTKNHISDSAYENGVKAGKNLHLGKVMGGANTKLLKA